MNARNIPIGGGNPLAFFSGPCVVESWDLVLKTASVVRDVAATQGIGAGCVAVDHIVRGL